MLAHAHDVALRDALVKDAYGLALTELLHHSEMCFLGRGLDRSPSL